MRAEPISSAVQPAAWDPGAPVEVAEAEDFVRLFHTERPGAGAMAARLERVRAEIGETGTYTHTRAELMYGARVAWRNASRCIGRLYWRGLRVLDRRGAVTGTQIFHDLVTHLRIAGGDWPAPAACGRTPAPHRRGQIRPVVSVFAPAVPGQPAARVWNEQLIRYAGYRSASGAVVGDPRYLDFTSAVARMGWQGKGEAFDVLPVVVQTPTEGAVLYELPEDVVLEVPLAHPEYRWFADLGLRWHAVPVIANMRLSIGGVQYPLAPFNGWYMGTEIGARNLGDADRYNLLPLLGAMLRLDTSKESTLWRDRALVELNRAVLWSFGRSGVRISDHHTESLRFLAHVEREHRAGRGVPADWSWIVPPMSGSLTGVFHRYYHVADQRPNFYTDPAARELALGGGFAGSSP
jgi:nitric-oxide synthase